MKKNCLFLTLVLTVITLMGCGGGGHGRQNSDVTGDTEVTGVSLDVTSATLDIGQNVELAATVIPSNATHKEIAWSTSDDGVATVTDGVVTAVAAGTAVIRATTLEGGYYDDCTVTVRTEEVGAETPVTGVSLDRVSATLDIGDNISLIATVTPANATDKQVSWGTSDETVASVVDGVVTTLGEGTAVIQVTTEDGNFTDSCSVTVVTLDPGEYLINYYLNGGVNHIDNPTTYTTAGDRVVFKEPTKEGRVFDAWYTEATFVHSISDIPTGSSGHVTIYAKWREPVEPDQENQPGGSVKIPALPAARAYWLAPAGMGDVGDIGAFIAGTTMTTADEVGLTSIAAPVTPGTYYLYYVIKDTKEILSISANFLTVVADNVPYYYNGNIYNGIRDVVDADNFKTTVQKTDLLNGWQAVGDSRFTDSLSTDSWGAGTDPLVAVNKQNGDVWALTLTTNTNSGDLLTDIELWKFSASAWNPIQTILIGGYTHSYYYAMAMINDASAMFISRTGWRPAGDWPQLFEKRTGADFGTATTLTVATAPSVLKIGGDDLYVLTQTNDFAANDSGTHTAKLSTHTGLTIQRYDMSTAFEEGNFETLGGAKFNVSGATKYYAFQPEMYINGTTPYVVFVEPTVYEHSRHNTGIPSWTSYGWNDYLEEPKLTVMRYNGAAWELVGDNLFGPEVYKTTATSYIVGTETVRAGFNEAGETDRTTTDTVYKPGICVGGGSVWVVATDASDEAFICEFDGTGWTTVKTNFATGVRNPKMVYDDGKLYILYTIDGEPESQTYIYTP